MTGKFILQYLVVKSSAIVGLLRNVPDHILVGVVLLKVCRNLVYIVAAGRSPVPVTVTIASSRVAGKRHTQHVFCDIHQVQGFLLATITIMTTAAAARYSGRSVSISRRTARVEPCCKLGWREEGGGGE